jgi:peptide/nickel transport system permease protein
MPSSTRASATDSGPAGSAAADARGRVAVAPVAAPPLAAAARPSRTRPWYLDVWVQMLRRKPLGILGAVIVVVMLGSAILADVITPYGFAETNLKARLGWISGQHWLGTDHLGRDLLTRIIYGARVSLYVGFGAVALGCALATIIGIGSGYFGGRADLLTQRGVDAWMAFPGLLLLLTIMSLIGPGVWNITLVLGVAFGIQNSRTVRSVTLAIKENAYIESARVAGAGHLRIALIHILPNALPTIIVISTTGLSTVILTEAALSFLGLGVPPPYPTWGGMLSLSGLDHMYQAPWMAIWPAVALSLAVFGFNMLGDALRDLFDPRLKGQ